MIDSSSTSGAASAVFSFYILTSSGVVSEGKSYCVYSGYPNGTVTRRAASVRVAV